MRLQLRGRALRKQFPVACPYSRATFLTLCDSIPWL